MKTFTLRYGHQSFVGQNCHLSKPVLFVKDQENPNFSAFGTCGSLSNDPVFDPGRLGKRSDGTKITKFYAKPEVERVKMHAKSNR